MSAAPAIEVGGQLTLGGGELPQLRPKLSQFFTPAWLAEAMADLAAVYLRDRSRAPRILEPSAGCGALVKPLLDRVPGCTVTAVEIDRRFRPALRALGRAGILVLDVADYLEREAGPLRRYDLAVSNPPWEHPLFALFLAKLMAESEAVLILGPSSMEHGKGEEKTAAWSPVDRGEWGIAVRIVTPARPIFAGRGGAKDVVILLLVKGWTGPAYLLRWREGDTPMPDRIESPVEAAQRALWRMYCEHIDHAGSDPVSLGEVSGIRLAAHRLDRDLSEAGDRPVDPDHAGHPRPRRDP